MNVILQNNVKLLVFLFIIALLQPSVLHSLQETCEILRTSGASLTTNLNKLFVKKQPFFGKQPLT